MLIYCERRANYIRISNQIDWIQEELFYFLEFLAEF